MVHPEIRQTIPDCEIHPAVGPSKQYEYRCGDRKTEVAQQDEMLILLLVQRAPRVEVGDATTGTILLPFAFAFQLLLVVIVSSHIRQEVPRPSKDLLIQGPEQRDDWRLLHQLAELMDFLANPVCVLLSSLGDEYHVALHVSGGLVMLSMRDLPTEVWDQERGMQDPTNGIIECFRGREGLMTALVGQYP